MSFGDFSVKTTSGFSDFRVGFVHISVHVVQQGTSLVCFFFIFTKLCKCFLDDVLSLSYCLSSTAPSSTILYNSDPLGAFFAASTFLSRLTPAHLSQQRSLSICLEVSNTSTYRVSFDRLPPRATIAHGSWVWNSNPFLTIRYASWSWHVSKPHCSFSLLTLVPFPPMKRKRIWIRDASLLRETVTWLSGIPEGIIHQKLPCHLPQQKAEAQVPSLSQLFISLFTPTFCVCLVQDCSRCCQHARTRCVRTATGHRDRFCNRFTTSWYFAIFISLPSNV